MSQLFFLALLTDHYLTQINEFADWGGFGSGREQPSYPSSVPGASASYNYQASSPHWVLQPMHGDYNDENFNINADTTADPFEFDSEESNTLWPPSALRADVAIGIVYLVTSPAYGDPLHAGELRIGVILQEKFRGQGLARKAVRMTIQRAFKDPICQRVQAIIPDGWAKDRALNLFMHMYVSVFFIRFSY